MLPEKDSESTVSEERPIPQPRTLLKTFLMKMAISARLMGKEIHQKKLRWFDLRRANYRLGKKAYESQLASPGDNRIIDRLNKIQDRIGALRQPVNLGSSFKERAKAVAKGGARFMKIQILKFKLVRAFRMLGAQTRGEQPSDASLAGEIELAIAVSHRINTNDADIRELAPRTYLWARKPLATVSIAIAASLLYAGITHQRAMAAPDVSTPKKAVQAFLEALERNDLALAYSLVTGTAEQVSVAKREYDLEATFSRLAIAEARKFEGEERAKEEADKIRSRWANANEKIEQDGARVTTGSFGPVYVLLREGPGWKIDLSRSSDGVGTDLDQAGPSVFTVVNEVTERVEKGYYKNKDEVAHDLRAKLAPLIAATEPKSSPTPNSSATPQPQLADIEALGRAALQCMQAFDDEVDAVSRENSEEVIAALRQKRVALEPESHRAAGLLKAAAAAGNERAATIVNIVRKRNEERTEKLKAFWKKSTPLVLSDGRRVRINDDEGEYYASKDPGDYGVKLTGPAKEEAQRLRAEWDRSRQQDRGSVASSPQPSPAASPIDPAVAAFLAILAAPDVSTPKKTVQAFLEALERNDMATARLLAIGSEQLLTDAKEMNGLKVALRQMAIAMAEKFEGEDKAKEATRRDSRLLAEAPEVINADKATVDIGSGGASFALQKEGGGWKLNLGQSGPGIIGTKELLASGPQIRKVVEETTGKIRNGNYKNKGEVDSDLQAKLAPLIAATEPKSSPVPSPITTPPVASTSTSRPTEALPTYTAREAKKHIGEIVTVTGTVACITRAADWQLYFDDCATRTAFFAQMRENASGPTLDVNKLKGVAIAVTGKIVGPTDRPWIVVETTSQIVKQREPTREELDAAIARTNKAVEANPYDPNAHYQRGLAKEKRAALDSSPEGYRAAITDYNQVLKLDSSHADALVHIGDCYAALQEYDAAKKAWDKAIEVSPKAKALLATSIEKEKARYCYAAISALDELIEMEPKNAALYYRRANLYLMDHANQTANADFQRASELEPTNLAYGLKASRPLAPSKRPPTADEIMNRVIGGGLTVLGAAITATALSDIAKAKARNEQLERVKRLIDASGGRKVECPKCNGVGNTSYSMDSFTAHDQNPHVLGSGEYNRFEEERRTEHVVKCNQCDGAGVVDK